MSPRRHRSLCIVIHDVAPETWPRCQTLLDKLAQIGDFPVTLLAVPRPPGAARNPAFEAWLIGRVSQGDEVALYDAADSIGPPGSPVPSSAPASDFGTLTLVEGRKRLAAGLQWLASLGIKPSGFVAPAQVLGDEAWRALLEQPLEYTCTWTQIFRLPAPVGTRGLPCRAQVYSSASAWRRWLSVAWCESLAWWQRGDDIVRLELHPLDVRSPAHRSWQRLARAQSRTRRVETLLSLARRIRVAPASTAS